MIQRPTVFTDICRLPVDVLGSESSGLVTWIILEDMDGNKDYVEFKDLVCIEGEQWLWRWIRFCSRLRENAKTPRYFR